MSANNAATFSRDTIIACDHPCLAGHFPGDPVVPGVVLLDRVADLIRLWKPNCRIAGIAQAKFHQLLRPEQRVTVTLIEQGAFAIKFVCAREAEKIASGVINIEIPV
jgi:3-hydroxyacyl-[acyl-carrier-protein] dehydratase